MMTVSYWVAVAVAVDIAVVVVSCRCLRGWSSHDAIPPFLHDSISLPLPFPCQVEIPFEDAVQWCGPNSVYTRSHLSTAELQATWSLDSLKIINPAELLNALVTRYFLDLNYTFCGPVLINMNPYKHVADWPCPEKPDQVQWLAHSPEVGGNGA